ncbi:glycosyltransferase [Homoserinibacter sp. YIM 151385]|uniref:glycosyltransferase n=1 Tax=Homoserinibacter sp. YIM 151385 TaxID=2985506 RepID=UPI0022F0A6C2|nr:glycosyltransferase [Homoserinibacter sp. YIM 151385]WBU37784.1 glycosyltransferase [Homoserinibacter sp. YIM 151385]
MSARSLGTGTAALVRALLPGEEPAGTDAARLEQLAAALPQPDAAQSWLLLAVLDRRLPRSEEVDAFRRQARHDGLRAAAATVLAGRRHPARWLDPPVQVLADAVLVDVHDTASSTLATGVQRLARAIGDRWLERGVQLVGWNSARSALVRVDHGAWREGRRRGALGRAPVVPWGGAYVLTEVVGEGERSARIQALARCSGARTMLVGADAIPLTAAETTGSRMPGVFAKYLAAAAHMDVVAAISGAAAAEYRGWRAMLPAAGIPGPEVVEVPIAEELGELDPSARFPAELRFVVHDEEGALPLVLCVGSHEPRKNHQAVLHAAELLWREGRRFSLAFVGGNAWRSEAFRARLLELREAGRPVAAHRGVPDAELRWAYRLARLTVFPSLDEGFGLPVAESLAAGTPVVTTRYGSTAEIAAEGGCVLVDPRDDRDLAAGIRGLLADDALLARLRTEAAARPPRTWDDYALRLWSTLMP